MNNYRSRQSCYTTHCHHSYSSYHQSIRRYLSNKNKFWISEKWNKASKNDMLDQCQLPSLTFLDDKMKNLHTSHGILEINYKSPPCLIWIPPNILRNNPLPMTMTEGLKYFIVQFKIKCLHASWLSIASSDTDLMLQFCLPNTLSCPRLFLSIKQ